MARPSTLLNQQDTAVGVALASEVERIASAHSDGVVAACPQFAEPAA
jgi:hypothetical protein